MRVIVGAGTDDGATLRFGGTAVSGSSNAAV
jgi:hypothetical protein